MYYYFVMILVLVSSVITFIEVIHTQKQHKCLNFNTMIHVQVLEVDTHDPLLQHPFVFCAKHVDVTAVPVGFLPVTVLNE